MTGVLAMTAETKIVSEDVRTAHEILYLYSQPLSQDATPVKGPDFEKIIRCEDSGDRLELLMSAFKTTGFQSTNLAAAIEEVNKMLYWKPQEEEDEGEAAGEKTAGRRCKIFLGYTSNMVSSGVREIIRFLVQHRLVDVLVTTAGGIEEDLIKCLAPTVLGDFRLEGQDLRKRGINRIGNLLIPNNNYCLFEDWLGPILDKLVTEQQAKMAAGEEDFAWSPSRLIARLGKEIDNPESILWWAWRNEIPVFSPAITDGSIGDMIYFHSYSRPGLILDLVADIRGLNNQAVHAKASGLVILGGGVVKHHICNANLMRNGADFAVFINTGQEFDGSDSGASPDEAVSWGKIKATANPVKVHCEATIAFPLIVAESFGRYVKERLHAKLGPISEHLYL